jgi:hypothetical protein
MGRTDSLVDQSLRRPAIRGVEGAVLLNYPAYRRLDVESVARIQDALIRPVHLPQLGSRRGAPELLASSLPLGQWRKVVVPVGFPVMWLVGIYRRDRVWGSPVTCPPESDRPPHLLSSPEHVRPSEHRRRP